MKTAFGVSTSSIGEGLKAYNALNNFGAGIVAAGGSGNTQGPKAFITVLLYDKNYNFVDVTYKQINPGNVQTGTSTKAAFDLMTVDKTVVEPGYAFIYLSNEDPHLVDVYFDDLTITQTKTNVLQYNEYYPFGLQTQNSWTRENTTGNNFLGNGGTELNATSSLYDLAYRNYDPILGRFGQVDPLADKYGSHTPYNYAFNDPVYFNDPSGADGDCSVCSGGYGSTYQSQWIRNNLTGRPARMDDGWNPNYGGPVFVGWSKEGGAEYGLPTKLVWNPWIGNLNSNGEREGGWALATKNLVDKIQEHGYELKYHSSGGGSSPNGYQQFGVYDAIGFGADMAELYRQGNGAVQFGMTLGKRKRSYRTLSILKH